MKVSVEAGPAQMACGRPDDDALIFPGVDGEPWTTAAYQSWRRAASGKPRHKTGKPGRSAGPFARALAGAGIDHARPYDLRHSCASLLLHEGRSVIDVARQLGHDARLTLTRYGHVIEELDGEPRLEAEAAIKAAREAHVPAQYPQAVEQSN